MFDLSRKTIVNLSFAIESIISARKSGRADKATGTFYIFDNGIKIFECGAVSGYWGRGYLPLGEYKIHWIDRRGGSSYSLHGFGWFAYIEQQFEDDTNRTQLGIHPDGNVPGTRGCIGLKLNSYQENFDCYKMIKSGLKKHGSLDLIVFSNIYDTRFKNNKY